MLTERLRKALDRLGAQGKAGVDGDGDVRRRRRGDRTEKTASIRSVR